MNIFYLSDDVVECAQMHCNKHVVKMILEYAQVLSTAHRFLDGIQVSSVSKTGRKSTQYVMRDSTVDQLLYKTTHLNHPSTVWTRSNIKHYMYLAKLLDALCKEYTHRYGRVHLTESKGLTAWLLCNTPQNIERDESKAFQCTPAMPDECKVQNDSIESYRKYYVSHKSNIAVWKSRPEPIWFKNMLQSAENHV